MTKKKNSELNNINSTEFIKLQGVRTHNLKNINVTIPRNKLVVITGLSGSGKSSLAFDTLFAEGQRRYIESLSAYARQFLSMMEKPDLDSVENLSPAISIQQKTTSHNPRSTVGTVTEIYDYLRLLFARIGDAYCPNHNTLLKAYSVSEIADRILTHYLDKKIMLLAPIVRRRKGQFINMIEEARVKGFVRVKIDGEIYEIDEVPELDKKLFHYIDLVVDRIKVSSEIRQRLIESLELCQSQANGLITIASIDNEFEDVVLSTRYACSECGFTLEELEPRIFSFNNPKGACSKCDGLGSLNNFDANFLVNGELAIEEGAIKMWGPMNQYSYTILSELCKEAKIDMEIPFKTIEKSKQDIILYGYNKSLKVSWTKGVFDNYSRKMKFEGVIPNLERRYKETDSNYIRAELENYMVYKSCDLCKGTRLNQTASNILIQSKNIADFTMLNIQDSLQAINDLKLIGSKAKIAEKILKEIKERLGFLINVGLDYLTLSRGASTLSGGENQRIRLASQIGSGLTGVLYVLDEPSVGLHQRDNMRLIKTLKRLQSLNNTVVVVEHDEEMIRNADYIIDIGPKAGKHGGEIVAQGEYKEVLKAKNSLTANYLNGTQEISIPKKRRKQIKGNSISINGCKGNNLKNVNLTIPLSNFVVITGVSGSGKSSLINRTFYPVLQSKINRANAKALEYTNIENIDLIDSVIAIDQNPIGKTPRSNPATYTNLFTLIRDLFTDTKESRARGYKAGRFSFNVKGGRCEICQGDGVMKVEMHFLPDIYVTCDVCKGKKYNNETLEIQFKGKNISDVLEMTVEESAEFFASFPTIKQKLETLLKVGLGYIKLGQNAVTLSGGESQRIKLAKELSKRSTGKTMYILDEPTTGLHFHDVKMLIDVLQKLVDKGNTVLVIEHNLDVVKCADWMIDLGVDGGNRGGDILYSGIPEQIKKAKNSCTAKYLLELLKS